MAGIIASSTSRPMLGAETLADKAVSGYIAQEYITLSTTPTGTTYAWSIALPSGSGARANLSADSSASVTFAPDVEGYYTVQCIVDSTTTYVIRMAVLSVSPVGTVTCLRLIPVADSQVPTPATGQTLYYSSTQSALAVKRTDGTVHTVDQT